MWDDLDWHVDQPLREDEADVILGFDAVGTEEVLESGVQGGIVDRFEESIRNERFYGWVLLHHVPGHIRGVRNLKKTARTL